MKPVITAEEAAIFQKRLDAFEAWRNGRTSYDSDSVPLGLRVSNEMRSELEVYRIVTEKPEKLFVYVAQTGHPHVTTWIGEYLGDIVTAGLPFNDNFGGRRRSLRVELRDGAGIYHGFENMSSGTYARLKRVKKQPHPLLGKRIEIPVHYDLWMRGARYGKVTAYRNGKPGFSDYVLVQMDHPQVKKRLKLWRHDWEYAKVIAN